MQGFPGSSAGKESTYKAGNPGSIPGSGRWPGEGIGSLHQYSWAPLVVQTVKNLPAMQEIWIQSLGWEDSIHRLQRSPGGGIATHSSILIWRILMDREAWRARVQGVTKSWTELSD